VSVEVVVDILIDALTGMFANVSIDFLSSIGVDTLSAVNLNDFKAIITALDFTLPAEESLLVRCAPCSC